MNKNDFKDFQNYLIDKKHFSSNTVNSYERDLRKLFIYLDSNGYDCDDIRSWLTEVCINNYMEYLRDNKYSAATLVNIFLTKILLKINHRLILKLQRMLNMI